MLARPLPDARVASQHTLLAERPSAPHARHHSILAQPCLSGTVSANTCKPASLRPGVWVHSRSVGGRQCRRTCTVWDIDALDALPTWRRRPRVHKRWGPSARRRSSPFQPLVLTKPCHWRARRVVKDMTLQLALTSLGVAAASAGPSRHLRSSGSQLQRGTPLVAPAPLVAARPSSRCVGCAVCGSSGTTQHDESLESVP